MHGLLANNAMVLVGPPLLANDPSFRLAIGWNGRLFEPVKVNPVESLTAQLFMVTAIELPISGPREEELPATMLLVNWMLPLVSRPTPPPPALAAAVVSTLLTMVQF